LYILGYTPSYATIYPSTLTFKKGDVTNVFWVSVGKNSIGTTGSVIFLLKGTNYQIYTLS